MVIGRRPLDYSKGLAQRLELGRPFSSRIILLARQGDLSQITPKTLERSRICRDWSGRFSDAGRPINGALWRSCVTPIRYVIVPQPDRAGGPPTAPARGALFTPCGRQ